MDDELKDAAADVRASVSRDIDTLKSSGSLGDYLSFKKMVTPMLIQVIFWVGIVAIVISALGAMTQSVLTGLLTLILGPLVWRIYCEIFIVLFKINDGVQAIAKQGGVGRTFD